MFWSYMKQKTSNRVTVGPLVRDRVVITDDKQMCGVLNQQYCSVFTREDLANLPEVEQTFHYGKDNELQDITFTRDKVKAKLAKLNPNSAPGPDKIWPRVLKKLAASLSIPLAIIFSTMHGRRSCTS